MRNKMLCMAAVWMWAVGCGSNTESPPADVSVVDLAPADTTPADVQTMDVAPRDASSADAPADVPAMDVRDASVSEVSMTDVPSSEPPSPDVLPDVAPRDVTSTDVPATDVTASDVPAGDAPATDGGTMTLTCGTATVTFPAYTQRCAINSDCAFVLHQSDCCGNIQAIGIEAPLRAPYEAAEMMCRPGYPRCGCPTRGIHADDDQWTFTSTSVGVRCTANRCTTYVLPM